MIKSVKNFIGLALGFFCRQRKRLLVAFLCAMFLLIAVIGGSYYVIDPYKKFIVPAESAEHSSVGIVLGSGITAQGKPYNELQARLDSAADAVNNGVVDRLILSGDNRYVDYNEPAAMVEYLSSVRGLPANRLQPDYAGRSTYESCERAAKVFKVDKAIIFSADSHLPRAIYLCRHFGIEAYGIGSKVEANNSTRREILARVKAIYNTELVGERTILGDPVPLN